MITKVTTNRAEGYVGNVKTILRRTATLGGHANSELKSARVFCAGYRLAHPGFHGVVRALRSYQDWVLDRVRPGDAFDVAMWRADD